MFIKYLRSSTRRSSYNSTQDAYRTARIATAQKEVERVREQLARREADLAAAIAPAPSTEPVEPSFRLIECAAYIYDCASGNETPSYFDANRRGFFVTGSALASALRDAIELAWIGRDAEWRLHWRDAGLSEECPLVILAKMRRKTAPGALTTRKD